MFETVHEAMTNSCRRLRGDHMQAVQLIATGCNPQCFYRSRSVIDIVLPFLTFSVEASVLIFKAELAPKEADGAKAAAGAANIRVARASFMVDILVVLYYETQLYLMANWGKVFLLCFSLLS